MVRIAWLIVLLAMMTVGVSADNMTREESEAKVAALQEAGDFDGLVTAVKGDNHILGGVAAMALAETRDPRVFDVLLTTMSDHPNKSTRGAATRALGKLGDSRAYEPLAAIVMDDTGEWEIRRMAIYGLGDLGDARATAPLLHALEEGFHFQAGLALRELGEPGLFAVLDYFEEHPDDHRLQSDVLVLFLTSQQEHPHPRFVAHILQLLELTNDEFKGRYFIHAAMLDAPEVQKRLVEIATEHPDQETRIAAIMSMGMAERSLPFDVAVTLLDETNAPEVRAMTIEGLIYSNDPRVIDTVLAVLHSDPERDVQECARFVLAELTMPADYFSTFITMLEDPNPENRLLAATILGKMADLRALEPLIALLRDTGVSLDESYLDEGYELEEFSELEDDVMMPVLVTDGAALALARLGDKRAIPALIDALALKADNWQPLQARNALRTLTGPDFGLDAKAWRAWWTQAGE